MIAVYRWVFYWVNYIVFFFVDNFAIVVSINKCSLRNSIFLKCFRSFFWLFVIYNFRFVVYYVLGIENKEVDFLLRFDDKVNFVCFL